MIYVVVEELIPESQTNPKKRPDGLLYIIWFCPYDDIRYNSRMKDYSIYNFSFSFNSIAYKPFFLQVNTNSIFLVEVLF